MRARRLRASAALAGVVGAALVASAAALAEPGWDAPVRFADAHAARDAYAVPAGGGSAIVLRQGGTAGGGWDPHGVYVDELAGGVRQRPERRLATSVHPAHLAGDGAGAALAAWADGGVSPPELRAALRDAGGDFGSAFALPQPAEGLPETVRAAMNADGDAVVLFVQEDAAGVHGLWATRREAGGAFSPAAAVPGVAASWIVPEVGISADGEVIAAWSEFGKVCEPDDGSCTWRARLRTSVAATGAPFSEPRTLGSHEQPPEAPAVAVDSRGGAVVAWRTKTGYDALAMVSIRSPGGDFGAPSTLGRASSRPTAGVSADGRFAIAYAGDASEGTPHVMLARGSTAGSSGEAHALERGSDPRLAVAPTGETVLTWRGREALRVAWTAADGSGGVPRDLACYGDERRSVSPAIALGGEATLLWRMSMAGDDPTRNGVGISRGSTSIPLTDPGCGPPSRPPPPTYPPLPPPGAPQGINPHWPWARDVLFSPPPPPGGDANTSPVWANGASAGLVFSQDNRRVRLIAFESDASNLVRGDRNGVRDVFVVRRGRGGGNRTGTIRRASVGAGGREANGPSSNASLDGETRSRPRCVAFESRATNLDRRDRSRDRDVYVRDLRRRATRLVSVGLRNAAEPVIDGRCRSVTFGSRGWVWVADVRSGRAFRLGRGSRADQQTNGEGAAYERAGQVWHRSFRLERRRGRGRLRLRRGRERLVSATRLGRPGNGVSSDPAADDAGHYVAFESTATNLCVGRCAGVSEDRNGRVKDVFRRTLSRRAPTRDSMQMVSFSYATRAQGNGPSEDPAMSGAGENVLFVSAATNLRRRDDAFDTNGPVRDVFSWTFPRRRGHGNVVRFARHGCVRGCRSASEAPSMSSRGNYIGFGAAMTEYCVAGRQPIPFDRTCPSFTDVFVRFVGDSHEGYPLG